MSEQSAETAQTCGCDYDPAYHREFNEGRSGSRSAKCFNPADRDPCMERRHHRTTHLTLHGSFEPVGGYLRTSPASSTPEEA